MCLPQRQRNGWISSYIYNSGNCLKILTVGSRTMSQILGDRLSTKMALSCPIKLWKIHEFSKGGFDFVKFVDPDWLAQDHMIK